MAGFFKFLIPKNQAFFDLFNQSSTNTVQMAELLYKIVSGETPDNDKIQLNQISRLKQTGNDLKHKVYLASAKAFVSPFERNDMYALASAINSVCDHIYISSRRFSLYQSAHVTPSIKELSGLVIETSIALDNSVKGLGNLANSDVIKENCDKIRQLENYADQVYGKAVSGIMVNETSSVEMIKYTEILSALERTTDKCEHATTVIESIIIKNK
jgi:uncharacterized protein Yka (UPF0111/DUF47 family)